MLTFEGALARQTARRDAAYARVELYDADPPPAERPVELPLFTAQHDFVTDTTTWLLMFIGGLGSGKTRALMTYVVAKMHRERGRGTVGMIAANTYKQLNQATLPWLWTVLEIMDLRYGRDYVYNSAPPVAWRYPSRFKDHNGVLTIRGWGQAITRSLDNPESLRGIEVGWIAHDEVRDTPKRGFDVAIGRLRCPRCSHREYRGSTTPNGYDWIYEELHEKGSADPGARRMIHARTTDNVFLPADYVENLLATYDPVLAQQEIEGLFVQANQGLVYGQFNRNTHLDPAAEPDPNLDWQVTFDFNRTPFSVVLCQTLRHPTVLGKQLVRCVDEVVMMDTMTENVCREIARRIKAVGGTGRVQVYGDPAGRSRDTRGNVSDYDIITREFTAAFGNRFEKKWALFHHPVLAGVAAVNGMFKNARGDVCMVLHPRCKALQKDLERVAYTPGSREISKTDKSLTHSSDALRYYVVERFPVSGGSIGFARI